MVSSLDIIGGFSLGAFGGAFVDAYNDTYNDIYCDTSIEIGIGFPVGVGIDVSTDTACGSLSETIAIPIKKNLPSTFRLGEKQ